MPASKVFSFNKRERLCSKLLMDRLFDGNASASMSVWPLRVVFQLVEKKDEEDVSVELLISVSKRYFKRAVKRNRVKRQIREAYRKNKSLLVEDVAQMPDRKLLMAVMWMDANLHPSAQVEEKMQKLLKRVGEKLHGENVQDRS